MRYKIKEFEFDSINLVLMYNGETIAIRHNEAKVLLLLLENANKVLKKEDILSHVWQDKVVTEQAVFQNISQLRALFGSDAIKTFPKRGYQWQLNVEVVNDTVLSQTESLETSPSNVSFSNRSLSEVSPPIELSVSDREISPTALTEKPSKATYIPYALIMCLLVILIGFISWPNNIAEKKVSTAINLAYIPIVDPQAKTSLKLEDNSTFDFSELINITPEQFMISAELEYPKLAKHYPFILTGKMRNYKQRVYLDFLLKGPYGDWQGQLWADSNEALVSQLQQHLSQPFIYQFLSSPQSPEFKKSSLSLAHQQRPEDPIILFQLINTYLHTQELDMAMTLAEKLATNARSQIDSLQLGNALLYQSTILTRKNLYHLSTDKLGLAIEAFESINDLSRQADAWHAQAWLDHQYDNYPAVKKSLLKSSQLAFDAGDKLGELNALTYLSIMANKNKQENDKYSYLRQAENKMKAYKLPIYHFAKIPFHYAIFAQTAENKEPHLKQVLEFTQLTPNNWVAQVSRMELVLKYIKQQRLNEAQAIVDSVTTDNAQNSYLKTLLAKENQQIDSFIIHAKRTFEQAQLAGAHTLSLDVALLLCSTPDIDVNYDFYSLYIDENSSEYWREENEVELLALNL